MDDVVDLVLLDAAVLAGPNVTQAQYRFLSMINFAFPWEVGEFLEHLFFNLPVVQRERTLLDEVDQERLVWFVHDWLHNAYRHKAVILFIERVRRRERRWRIIA